MINFHSESTLVQTINEIETPSPITNPYNQSWAIIIGIEEYHPDSGMNSIDHAVNSAKAIQYLFEGLGYQTITLFNKDATKQVKQTNDENFFFLSN